MNFVTKLATSVALAAGILLAPAAALAYYPYTYFTGTSYFTGPDYFNGGGGFSTGPTGIYGANTDYYGSSNCSTQYGCGNIGYNAMTGQWTNGGPLMGCSGACNQNGYGYGSQMGYGQFGGAYANSGNNNFYMQYIPANVRQYVQMGYGNYGGYGYQGGFGGYVY